MDMWSALSDAKHQAAKPEPILAQQPLPSGPGLNPPSGRGEWAPPPPVSSERTQSAGSFRPRRMSMPGSPRMSLPIHAPRSPRASSPMASMPSIAGSALNFEKPSASPREPPLSTPHMPLRSRSPLRAPASERRRNPRNLSPAVSPNYGPSRVATPPTDNRQPGHQRYGSSNEPPYGGSYAPRPRSPGPPNNRRSSFVERSQSHTPYVARNFPPYGDVDSPRANTMPRSRTFNTQRDFDYGDRPGGPRNNTLTNDSPYRSQVGAVNSNMRAGAGGLSRDYMAAPPQNQNRHHRRLSSDLTPADPARLYTPRRNGGDDGNSTFLPQRNQNEYNNDGSFGSGGLRQHNRFPSDLTHNTFSPPMPVSVPGRRRSIDNQSYSPLPAGGRRKSIDEGFAPMPGGLGGRRRSIDGAFAPIPGGGGRRKSIDESFSLMPGGRRKSIDRQAFSAMPVGGGIGGRRKSIDDNDPFSQPIHAPHRSPYLSPAASPRADRSPGSSPRATNYAGGGGLYVGHGNMRVPERARTGGSTGSYTGRSPRGVRAYGGRSSPGIYDSNDGNFRY